MLGSAKRTASCALRCGPVLKIPRPLAAALLSLPQLLVPPSGLRGRPGGESTFVSTENLSLYQSSQTGLVGRQGGCLGPPVSVPPPLFSFANDRLATGSVPDPPATPRDTGILTCGNRGDLRWAVPSDTPSTTRGCSSADTICGASADSSHYRGQLPFPFDNPTRRVPGTRPLRPPWASWSAVRASSQVSPFSLLWTPPLSPGPAPGLCSLPPAPWPHLLPSMAWLTLLHLSVIPNLFLA